MIIEDVAKKLNIKPSQVFLKAATDMGYADPEWEACIWLARYVETQFLCEQVVDWALDIMMDFTLERLKRHPEKDFPCRDGRIQSAHNG